MCAFVHSFPPGTSMVNGTFFAPLFAESSQRSSAAAGGLQAWDAAPRSHQQRGKGCLRAFTWAQARLSGQHSPGSSRARPRWTRSRLHLHPTFCPVPLKVLASTGVAGLGESILGGGHRQRIRSQEQRSGSSQQEANVVLEAPEGEHAASCMSLPGAPH